MTKFANKSFSVPMGGKAYGDNWDRIFKKNAEAVAPEELSEASFPDIVALRERADQAWANGEKAFSDMCHREASRLAAERGVNIVRCARCEVYMTANKLELHQRTCEGDSGQH